MDFDVILLDPPPAMVFLGLHVMAAATGLLIPVPARQLAYLSTIHFMETIADNIAIRAANGPPVHYGVIMVLYASFSPNKPGENEIWRNMKSYRQSVGKGRRWSVRVELVGFRSQT